MQGDIPIKDSPDLMLSYKPLHGIPALFLSYPSLMDVPHHLIVDFQLKSLPDLIWGRSFRHFPLR